MNICLPRKGQRAILGDMCDRRYWTECRTHAAISSICFELTNRDSKCVRTEQELDCVKRLTVSGEGRSEGYLLMRSYAREKEEYSNSSRKRQILSERKERILCVTNYKYKINGADSLCNEFLPGCRQSQPFTKEQSSYNIRL